MTRFLYFQENENDINMSRKTIYYGEGNYQIIEEVEPAGNAQLPGIPAGGRLFYDQSSS